MQREPFLQRAEAFIRANALLPEAGTVLCAVSGGADSVCMLTVLSELTRDSGCRLAVAHFDHQLRGEASREDARFTEALAASMGLPFYPGSANVAALAAEQHQGLEAAAREARYAFLRETAETVGAACIATAHTKRDNAETVLMHLARGSGLAGLGGIAPKRDDLIRPLLFADRPEIEAFLTDRGINWREDATNADVQYTRNRIRHRVIPELETVNSRFCEAVDQTADRVRRDEAFLNSLAAEFLQENAAGDSVNAAALAALPEPVATRAVRLMAPVALTARQTADILALAAGASPSASLDMPGFSVCRQYELLCFGRQAAGTFEPVCPVLNEWTEIPGLGLSVRLTDVPDEAFVYNKFYSFRFKKEAVCGKLIVRPRNPGDKLHLPGRPEKSLRRLMMEASIPAASRDAVPVIADDLGILAVSGFGVDERAAVKTGDAFLTLSFEETSNHESGH